ncbi:BnaUnng01040D [Brassica napus]|uniref:(rape) hypothetical protein n=1 Tax=Brassica napus TaxID=3708 RepID=A0A078JBV1_BRANA|nr:unnamed protein product [Brassica napus]CDY65113.1 BnaUnng01040D [Brassica napus]
MKEPPQLSRLHQQEPPYQSPPLPPPLLHQQELPQAPRTRGRPPPTSTTPVSFTSAAPNYTSEAELEKTKPRLGFAGGVETTYHHHHHHQNRDNQRPNLSPRSSSLWAELSFTMNPQGYILDWALSLQRFLEMGQEAIEWMKRNVIPRFCKFSFPETPGPRPGQRGGRR